MLKIYLKLLQKYRPAAGWTLAELMIAAGMTLVVVMVSGFGLMTILKENKVANATGAMQYDINRATEFISEEIRSAKTIETKMELEDLKLYAPTFARRLENNPDYAKAKPILALKIEGIYERVIYYIDEVDDNEPWRGPMVIKRFGPQFFQNGGHIDPDDPNNDKGRKVGDWDGLTLVDMIVENLDDGHKDCTNLIRNNSEEGEYTDSEGNKWFRFPRKTAEVKGFFGCVREDKQLVQFNLVGTTLEEFQHLGYKQKGIRSKESRHADKMEYEVVSMAHARSELSGGNGRDIPSFRVNPDITFEEPGNATIDVVYAKIPCYDNTTSNQVSTVFYTEQGGVIQPEGRVNGTGQGSAVSFQKNSIASPHISETRSGGCSQKDTQYELDPKADGFVEYATNDTGDRTKLNDIVPSSSHNFQDIVNQLSSKGLIKPVGNNIYNFFIPDNTVVYFVEFETETDIIDPATLEAVKQTDTPNFDDAVIVVKVTETR